MQYVVTHRAEARIFFLLQNLGMLQCTVYENTDFFPSQTLVCHDDGDDGRQIFCQFHFYFHFLPSEAEHFWLTDLITKYINTSSSVCAVVPLHMDPLFWLKAFEVSIDVPL